MLPTVDLPGNDTGPTQPQSQDSKNINIIAKSAAPIGKFFNRRNLLAVLGLAASGTAVAAADKNAPALGQRLSRPTNEPRQQHLEPIATAVAKQQIAELRCLYAKATDLIGTTEPQAVAEGRRIYHQIFRPDAVIGATGRDDVTGPDAWVDVVLDALKVYEKTQHLIGTQLVEVQSLPDGGAATGRASMTSYLQAWHAKADGELWLFIGSYADQLVHSPQQGWQIAKMMLSQVSGETRQLNG